MTNYFEGLGITPRELSPGTVVMVPMGRIASVANGQPCVIEWAVVRGPASEGVPATVGPDDVWWLDVYAIPGGPPLPQMYRAGEILGVPALGLSMQGAPTPEIELRG